MIPANSSPCRRWPCGDAGRINQNLACRCGDQGARAFENDMAASAPWRLHAISMRSAFTAAVFCRSAVPSPRMGREDRAVLARRKRSKSRAGFFSPSRR